MNDANNEFIIATKKQISRLRRFRLGVKVIIIVSLGGKRGGRLALGIGPVNHGVRLFLQKQNDDIFEENLKKINRKWKDFDEFEQIFFLKK